MNSKELNEQLLMIIPSLRSKFDEICKCAEGIETGSTIVMEDVFLPYVIDAVLSENTDSIKLASSFIEWLSGYYDDEYAGTVLVTSIYESIHYSHMREKLEKVLGIKSSVQYQSIKW